MLGGTSSKGHKQTEGEGAVVRRGHLKALVVTFLIGCAVLLVFGCAGTSPETSKKEQGRAPEATAPEEAQCEGTRTKQRYGGPVVTNDVPGCPNGGLLLGTDKTDTLAGLDGDDEIRGLGGRDFIGDGNDFLMGIGITVDGDGQRDKFYCGEGRDRYAADKNDYVDSSCEVKVPK